MKRPDIINFLKEKGVDFNPTLKLAELETLYTLHSNGEPTPLEKKDEDASKEKPQSDTAKMLEMMGGIVNKIDSIDSRLKKVEGPDSNAFKSGAKTEDIDLAASQKASIDPKVVAIV